MPELPEVETIVRDLRPSLVGRVITRVELIRPSVLRFGDSRTLPFLLEGQAINAVARRGKFIHLRLGRGEHLVVHLGMTGTLTMAQPSTPRALHTHLILDLDNGSQLRYRDPRRFGRVLSGQPSQMTRMRALPHLGPDPLSPGFATSGVAETLRNSSRRIKSALLDQALIAGCGNIYADEACFLARVRPTRRGATLTRLEALRLVLDGWRVSAIGTASSGAPYSYKIFGGTYLKGGRETINGSGGATYLPTIGRNTLRLAPRGKVDLRLGREVNLGRGMHLNAFAEAFNLFNAENISSVETRAFQVGTATTIGNSTASGPTPLVFQDAAAIATEGLTTEVPFGTPSSSTTGISRERQLELGMRLQF